MGKETEMYYEYKKENSIHIPAPYKRDITPVFMGDDDKIAETNFSIHLTEWAPGCTIDEHSHPDGMEAMYLMSGKGIAIVNGEEHEFRPDTMIVAPPGITHKIINTGDEVLRVLCVFSPPVTGKSLRERAMNAVDEAEK
ncbi:cupin domain-containing protein [Ruminococcus sp. CLA-AA-H200]|uniref:Cupin domain-containing protein n=1 Tax=Ruminococcus turbiniformis TaxID=2881258 RepID=A0ABS8FYZ7_9FIRM|nr:cupin domain-containing protein [Ruminococcus turbiniformis]MCC2255275.1 cupin domain-containing protein [Ruminococcus turbiniformis]